jgi:maltose O-acetyltransferase
MLKRQFIKTMRFLRFGYFLRSLLDLMNEIENDRLKRLPGISQEAILRGKIVVTDVEKIQIGPQSVVNDNTYFETRGHLKIGRNVHLARGLTIWTIDHNYRSAKSIPYDEVIIEKSVVIKDFVWIGANVSIIPGIIVEEGAIVGMGAVVTKDVPYCAIVGGSPAKVIGYRDVKSFEKLKVEKKFG